MKIDNQDIIRTARQLRDEENAELHVSPWNRHRHFHVPTWLVAIPAAAIIGFVLGLWTQANSHSDVPLTALVDTVYIKVPSPQPQQDSVAQVFLPHLHMLQNQIQSRRLSAQRHQLILRKKNMAVLLLTTISATICWSRIDDHRTVS